MIRKLLVVFICLSLLLPTAQVFAATELLYADTDGTYEDWTQASGADSALMLQAGDGTFIYTPMSGTLKRTSIDIDDTSGAGDISLITVSSKLRMGGTPSIGLTQQTIDTSDYDYSGSDFGGVSGRSIAIDSNGYIWVIYGEKNGSGDDDLKVDYSDDDGDTWANSLTVTSTGVDYSVMSIAIDSADTIYIAYQKDAGTTETVHTQYYDGSWHGEENIEAGYTDQAKGALGLAVDSTDEVHVIYTMENAGESGSENLRYANRANKASAWANHAWVHEENSDFAGGSIAIDSNDYIHVVYSCDDADGYYDINYRYNNGSWQAEEVLCDGQTDMNNSDEYYPSLAIDSDDVVHVAWTAEWDNSKEGMGYIYGNTSSWSSIYKTVDLGGTPYHGGIAIDENDTVYIAYYVYVVDSNSYYAVCTDSGISTPVLIDEGYEPMLMWANYPEISGEKTNVVDNGFVARWYDYAEEMILLTYSNEIPAGSTNSGVCRPFLYNGTTVDYGDDLVYPGMTAMTDWAFYSDSWSTNPFTGDTWDWSDIDDIEIGIQAGASGDSVYIYCSMLYITVYYTGVSAPAINVNEATQVAKTSAQLNATVLDDGDQECEVRFGYGTSSQSTIDAYDEQTDWVSGYETGEHPYVLATGLSASTPYYFRAEIKNDHSTVVSTSEETFTTLGSIAAPTNFVATPNSTSIDLNWVKGAGSTQTLVRYSFYTFPTSTSEGFELYEDTSTSTSLTDLSPGQRVYFSAWGESGGAYSASYATAMATTIAGAGDDDEDTDGDGIPDSEEDDIEYTSLIEPTNWFLDIDYTTQQNMPWYNTVNDIADDTSMPRETVWQLGALFFAACGSIGIFFKNKELLPAAIVFGIGVILFCAMRLLPGWTALPPILIVAGIGMSRGVFRG